MRPLMAATACVLILSTGITGCATTSSPSGRNGAVADSCQPLRKPFDKARTYVRDQAITGAVTGALLGALTGAIVGDGKGKNIARGALAGAVTGSLVAYVAAKKQNASNVAELQSLIDNDFAGEMGVYSVMAGNLAALGDCRRGQLHALREELESGRLDKVQGRAKLDAIEQAIAQDDVVVSAAAQVQTRRVIYYAQAQGVAEGLQETQVANEAEVVRFLGGDPEIDRYRAQVTVVGGEDEVAPDSSGATMAAATSTAYAQASGARVRAKATTQSAEIAMLPPGAAVQVVGPAAADPAWSEVRHGGQTGFIRSDLLGSTRASAVAAAAPKVIAAPPKPRRPKGPKLVRVSTPMVAARAPKDRARQAIGAQRSFADARKADKAATLETLEALRRLT